MPSVVSEPVGIRDIWQSNIEEEFKNIRQIVKKYNYIAMVCCLLPVVKCSLGGKASGDMAWQGCREALRGQEQMKKWGPW